MSDDAARWREKYLKGIEQQEKLERRWNARLDLLRRGLVRSSLAAEGSDRAVDQCMKEMREIVRRDDMDAGLAALIPRLEKAVLDSEQRRETRVGQMSTALTALVTQLQRLPLPRDVSRPLKAYAKNLDDRVSQLRGNCPCCWTNSVVCRARRLTCWQPGRRGQTRVLAAFVWRS